MTTDPVSVGPQATLREVAELLSEHHITGAPVLAPGDGLIGVVSASDLIDFAASSPGVPAERAEDPEWGEIRGPNSDALAANGPGSYFLDLWDNAGADVLERFRASGGPEWNVLEEHTADEVMSRRVISIAPDAAVSDAARVMLDNAVHRLLVVDHGRLVGVVTAKDLLDVLAQR